VTGEDARTPAVRGKQALRDYRNSAVARGGRCGSRSSGCCGMPALGSWRSSTALRPPVDRGAFQKHDVWRGRHSDKCESGAQVRSREMPY
jgi:hypothetical protein